MACSSCAKKAALRNSRVVNRMLNKNRRNRNQPVTEETNIIDNQNTEQQNEEQSDLS